jgi:3-phenylpropionate/cinnamic acid dioxygenase small subunit
MSESHEAIRNLLGTYCEVMDAGDWDGLGALFAHARFKDENGTEITSGASGVAKLYGVMVQLHDGSPRTRHLVSGPVIEVDGEQAVCRSSFLVVQQVGEGPLQAVAAGRYRDAFAVIDGSWCFTERQFFLEQRGDMSSHLVNP